VKRRAGAHGDAVWRVEPRLQLRNAGGLFLKKVDVSLVRRSWRHSGARRGLGWLRSGLKSEGRYTGLRWLELRQQWWIPLSTKERRCGCEFP